MDDYWVAIENYDGLWLTSCTTARDWVNALDSFAIYSLRFFLQSARNRRFIVEILVANVF
jgi:hypothetical protein